VLVYRRPTYLRLSHLGRGARVKRAPLNKSIFMRAVLVILICVLGCSAFATHPGSVVSSFYAAPLRYGSVTYFPQGLTYGDGYIWVIYAEGIATKRQFPTGSLLTTFICPAPAWGGEIAWDSRRKYIYLISVWSGVYWVDSRNGSIIGSFTNPRGAGPLYGIEYNDYYPRSPIWVGDYKKVFNLDTTGSVVKSFDLSTWPHASGAYAFDSDTAGGPYIFVAAVRAGVAPWIYVVKPADFSVITSFVSPLYPSSLADIAWDGQYLWGLENCEATVGWVKRFVAHSSPNIEPASIGKIKALYR
jgi:hypothetical protein